MGDLPKASAGGLTSVAYSTSCPWSNPWGIRTENWVTADKTIGDIIRQVQPTSVSEERRRKVIDYIQRLIQSRLGAEVFPYGSVPLKTYLPDGDLDLTALGGPNFEDTLVDDINSVLEEQEKNTISEFVVKDVQIIRAEVKIVKCIVQDIVVDVSFNQIGGLSTLCFLEQVDRLIGKDHLFKRSIILIKAWCYYESRILGAHHGLISTYALETLVLYIFHLYHSMLDGPLAVLYKFLDHFSKFDWDTYCVSLHGPVLLSSLPDIVAEMPEDSDRDLLLSYEFLNYCVGKFSVPSTGGDKLLRGFQRKHLNIVDPLKEINNLGRSVSKGNFYRIRSAFSYGARKLSQILLQPKIYVADELYKFFTNTLARHGGAQSLDIKDLEQTTVCKRPISGVHFPETVLYKIDSPNEFDQLDSTRDFKSTSGNLTQDLSRVMESTSSDMASELHRSISELKHQTLFWDRDRASITDTLDPSFCGDSNGLAPGSALEDLKISHDSSIHQIPCTKDTIRAVSKPFFAPHLYFSNSKSHDVSKKDLNQDSEKEDNYGKNCASSNSFGINGRRVAECASMVETHLVDKETVPSSKSNNVLLAPNPSSISGEPSHENVVQNSAHRSETTTESLSSLDLTGDYDGYLRCLHYGRWCYEQGLGMQHLHVPPLPTTVYQNNNLWDGLLPPLSNFKQNGFAPLHLNGFHPNPTLYALQPVILPGVRFGWEEAPKPRGTGTYIPNMNQASNGYRSASLKGKNHASSKSPRDNGRNMSFPNTVDRSSHELSQPQVPVETYLVASSSNGYMSLSPRGCKLADNANGSSIQSEAVVEFEEVGPSSRVSVPEIGRPGLVCSSPMAISGMQLPQPSLSRKQDRILLGSSYRLKDEDDFPPLSVPDGVARLSVT